MLMKELGKENRYKILKKLAEGGTGVTYLVWDIRLEQEWVMKCIDLCGGVGWQAAWQEIGALKTLRREGIPVLSDVLYSEQRVCLIMEYMRGSSLEEKIQQEGRMDEAEAIACGLQIVELLSFLHHMPCRLVHGDLKPANLIWQQERIALLDFGAAMFQYRKKEAGMREGIYYTPGYAAPELLRGASPSAESDVYALGAVLFYLLTGEAIREGRGICPIREEIPTLSRGIEQFILTCTHADKSLRYHSMEEAGKALSALLEAAKRRKSRGWLRSGMGQRKTTRYRKQFRTLQNILLTDSKMQAFVLNCSQENALEKH